MSGAPELDGQGGQLPTHFFAYVLKIELCRPIFETILNSFWSFPPTLKHLCTPLIPMFNYAYAFQSFMTGKYPLCEYFPVVIRHKNTWGADRDIFKAVLGRSFLRISFVLCWCLPFIERQL